MPRPTSIAEARASFTEPDLFTSSPLDRALATCAADSPELLDTCPGSATAKTNGMSSKHITARVVIAERVEYATAAPSATSATVAIAA